MLAKAFGGSNPPCSVMEKESITKASKLFERVLKLNEASGNKISLKLAELLDSYSYEDKQLVDAILCQLSSEYIGEKALEDDLPAFYNKYVRNIRDKIFVAAAVRCNDTLRAFEFYKHYKKDLDIDLRVLESIAAYLRENPKASVSDAKRAFA